MLTGKSNVQNGLYTAELRDEKAVEGLVSTVIERHGRVHALVNAAGGQFPAPLDRLSLNGWNAVVHNNLTSYFLMAREVHRQCMASYGGVIVNIGADYDRGMPGMGHNGAARAGLSNLTFTAASEWAPAGVRVNCVIPGFIATTGLDRYPEDAWNALRGIAKRVPLQRHGTAAEVSAAVNVIAEMYISSRNLSMPVQSRNGCMIRAWKPCFQLLGESRLFSDVGSRTSAG